MSVLTMRGFGKWGRFGNQVFQYAFLRSYAAQRSARLELPPWVGNDLFGTSEPAVTTRLPAYKERTEGPGQYAQSLPPVGNELLNHDFEGYAQYHTSHYVPHREAIRRWLRPCRCVQARLAPAVARLREGAGTVIGLHLRRGDYGRLIFYITPVEWYLRWLETHWGRFPRPRLFLACEDRALVSAFRDYRPVTAESLGVSLASQPMAHYSYLSHDRRRRERHQLDFYPDFHLLCHCDVLVIPNSTYSFAAAMLAHSLREFYRSSLPAAGFVQEDPWDAYPCQRDRVEDHSHLPGIRLTHNPYW